MTYTTPCRQPDADPDDWFIEPNGKQYRDDDENITESMIEAAMREGESHDAALKRLQAEWLKVQLRKRRNARDMCFTDCQVRLWCLGQSMTPDLTDVTVEHGIFGGYDADERRTLARERRRPGGVG